ncbi:hypothetical protein GOP47_0001222 [Adiantum capillus-veneris]|uniref:Uncharacterized protein n=1 Tax=Adiantum capillus-veneris TaxID=13818 RepID=A0A9D4VGH1_ADICA|nr:hypothetical protein GOP47_0001222 [Adiantum capillus-veneris]
MGSLQHDLEIISNSPLSPSAFDEDGSLVVGRARAFFMNNGDNNGGIKKEKDYAQSTRNEGQNISNARGNFGYGTNKIKGLDRSSNASHEGLGYVDSALHIHEDHTKLQTQRRSLNIGHGILQYKRERQSFGYGEEEKRALGVVHGYGGGIDRVSVGGEGRGYDIDGDKRERQSMAKSGQRERENEKRYIRGDRHGDEKKEERGRENEEGFKRDDSEDGHCDEGRRGRESVGEQGKGGKREEGGRGRHMEGEEEKREEVVNRESEKGNGVVVVEEGVDYVHRGQWLRAAILGANDGLVSTASLMLGVGAVKGTDPKAMVISGLAGLVGGACSMAIGEFISVYSQRDAERFDKKSKALEEKAHSIEHPQSQKDLEEGNFTLGMFLSKTPNKKEFTHVPAFKDDSKKVVLHSFKLDVGCGTLNQHCGTMKQLGSHFGERKEKVVDKEESSIGPSPWEAAGASGLAFALGAMVPLLSASFIRKESSRISVMLGICSVALFCMGGIGAKLSAGSILKGSLRVLLGGWSAMLITYGLLRLFATSGV